MRERDLRAPQRGQRDCELVPPVKPKFLSDDAVENAELSKTRDVSSNVKPRKAIFVKFFTSSSVFWSRLRAAINTS